MRLLLDECVPKRLRRELPGHEVRTAQEAGWAGVKNGALLRAADGQFPLIAAAMDETILQIRRRGVWPLGQQRLPFLFRDQMKDHVGYSTA